MNIEYFGGRVSGTKKKQSDISHHSVFLTVRIRRNCVKEFIIDASIFYELYIFSIFDVAFYICKHGNKVLES